MSEWRTIDSAPRDGTEIILRKGDRVTSGSWVEWSASAPEHNSMGAYLGDVEYDGGACWGSWDGGFCERVASPCRACYSGVNTAQAKWASG